MAAKKRKQKSGPTSRSVLVLSTAVISLISMTVAAGTSGSVLLCFFAAKRFCDKRLAHDYELPTVDLCDGSPAGYSGVRRGSQ